MNKIIINADDFGLSDGICQAIVELIEMNAISNTSIMICSIGAINRVKKWQDLIKGKAGVHLQLSGGLPISPMEDVRSLTSRTNNAFLDRNKVINPDPMEVELEWTRQIELCAEILGETPTHLDSHRGVHRLDNCIEVYVALAKKYNIPVRGGDNPKLNERIFTGELKGSTMLLKNWTGLMKSASELINLIKGEETNKEIIEVITHPGYSDDYLKKVSSLNVAREWDMNALIQIKEEDLLSSISFELTTFANL